MFNNRPIESPRLQKALDEVQQVLGRYGFAGAAMIVSANEAAFFYKMHAPWSALRYDPETPMGFRLRANSKQDGKEGAHERIEGAMHTICQLADFASQTTIWMEDLKDLARTAGIDFQHTPHGGKPIPHLGTYPAPPPDL